MAIGVIEERRKSTTRARAPLVPWYGGKRGGNQERIEGAFVGTAFVSGVVLNILMGRAWFLCAGVVLAIFLGISANGERRDLGSLTCRLASNYA